MSIATRQGRGRTAALSAADAGCYTVCMVQYGRQYMAHLMRHRRSPNISRSTISTLGDPTTANVLVATTQRLGGSATN